MPASVAELRRGRIFYALFPFAFVFPANTIDSDGRALHVAGIEDYARLRKGQPTRIVTEARLRPVLLLHDGTRGEHEDATCLRINTVKPRHRADGATWERIENQRHPVFYYLAAGTPRYGLRADSIIALTSIGTIHKSSIFGRHVGELSQRELQEISERLIRTLSLDITPLIVDKARTLAHAAGIEL